MSDEQLIQEILSGNKDAFHTLMLKYQQPVFRTVMGFVHSKEDAEDVTQDVFLQVFRSLSTFQGNAKFSTWLYRIALNTSINHVNRNRRNLLTVSGDALMSIFNRSDDDKNPQQQLEISEREKLIRQAVDQLPEKQRKAFVLSKYEELSQREIAEIMETSEGAVEQLLQRAKLFLRKKLAHLVGK